MWLVNAYLRWSGCGKGFVVLAEHEKMILFKSHIPSKKSVVGHVNCFTKVISGRTL